MSGSLYAAGLQPVPALRPNPSQEVQAGFFNAAFEAANPPPLGSMPFGGKRLYGPLVTPIQDELRPILQSLKEIGQHLTPDYLLPFNDQPQNEALDVATRDRLAELRLLRQAALRKIGKTIGYPALRGQTLEALSPTPYYQQGDGGDPAAFLAAQGCMNACFRMIFGSITGWQPSEVAVAQAINQAVRSPDDQPSKKYYKTTNHHYLNIFHTPNFAQRFRGGIATREIIGADFAILNRYADHVRRVRPGSSVYCIAQLGSELAPENPDRLHAVVVLGANATGVTCHDPSERLCVGQPRRKIPIEMFAHRWAFSYNLGLVVVRWLDPSLSRPA